MPWHASGWSELMGTQDKPAPTTQEREDKRPGPAQKPGGTPQPKRDHPQSWGEAQDDDPTT